MKIHTKFNLCYCWLGLITLLLLHVSSQESQAYDLKEYYPLQVGDVRLYFETETGDGQTEWWDLCREPIIRTETIGGIETFICGGLSGQCWGCEEYDATAWDSEGLKFYREVECEDGELEVIDFDPPFLEIPRQLDLYETKKWTAQDGDEEIELEITLEAVENVTVYAGTFNNCLRTLWRLDSEDESEECHTWFAKGIGIVKEECTFTEDGETSTETMELVAAAVDHSLYGSPLRTWLEEEWFSFYLAHISTSGCDMVMDNVVIALQGETPILGWVKFTLNLDVMPIAWTITDAGLGTSPFFDPSSATVCPIQGLDFSQALHKMNIHGANDPQLWMRFPYGDENYMVGFRFPLEKLSWDIYFGPDLVE